MKFRKSSKVGYFRSKNLYCWFWAFVQGFKAFFLEEIATWFSEDEGRVVKACLEFFWKFIRFVSATRPRDHHNIPLKYSISFELFLWRRLSWKGLSIIVQILNVCVLLLTYIFYFKYLFSTVKIFLLYFSNIFKFKIFVLYFWGPAFVSVVTLELRVAIRIEFFTRWACKIGNANMQLQLSLQNANEPAKCIWAWKMQNCKSKWTYTI